MGQISSCCSHQCISSIHIKYWPCQSAFTLLPFLPLPYTSAAWLQRFMGSPLRKNSRSRASQKVRFSYFFQHPLKQVHKLLVLWLKPAFSVHCFINIFYWFSCSSTNNSALRNWLLLLLRVLPILLPPLPRVPCSVWTLVSATSTSPDGFDTNSET